MTELGSAPSAPFINSAPQEFAHFSNCSDAAARNVSPAANTTLSFSLDFQFATFATEVVFPTPLTPTKTQTEGSPPESSSVLNF